MTARRQARGGRPAGDVVVGRHAVADALRDGVPAQALFLLQQPGGREETDVTLAALAAAAAVPVRQATREQLDAWAGGAVHQGVALQVAPFPYVAVEDLAHTPSPLLVAVDGVTDPRNLGAIARSAAAFGATGLVVPERRNAQVTAAAWKASAGAFARLPVARVVNLARTLRDLQRLGLTVVGLDAAGAEPLDAVAALDVATDPLVLVCGSEGRGIGRLVGEACDYRLAIPMAGGTESLNVSVAAAVVLAAIAQERRRQGLPPWGAQVSRSP